MDTLLKYMSFRDKKSIVGLFFAGIVLPVFFCTHASPALGLLFSALFVFLGCLRIPVRRRGTGCLISALWAVLTVTALVFFPFYEVLQEHMPRLMKEYTSVRILFINAALILSLMLIFLAVTARFRLSVVLTAVLLTVLIVINGYIFRFRGTEFIFPDIFSSKTAFNVAAQYDLQIQNHTLYGITAIALLLFSVFSFSLTGPKSKKRVRLSAAASGFVLILLFLNVTKNSAITTWTWDGTLMNGYYLNFYISVRDTFIRKPDAYSLEGIRQLEQQYPRETGQTGCAEGEELPDILVIMNESFADFRVFGSEVQSNREITPFLDSLSENTVKGYALTSVYGGTTANAEFEFLTGFSTQFLPSGTVAYQLYIPDLTPSLSWALGCRGYQTMATHPYNASGWNRPVVYPRLGIPTSTFIDDYPQEKLLRSYVSDQEMYEYVLTQLAAAESPLFLFGITMQNHGGYTDSPDVPEKIQLEGYSREYPLAENYFTLLHQSDLALEYLLTELEKSSQKTIVLFFGDHFPGIEPAFYEELYGQGFDTPDDKARQYMVPFLIWANYDIPEQTVPCTSLVYLPRYLMETAGIDLPPYYRFLKDLEQVIPAINGFCYYSSQNRAFIPVEDAQGTEAQWLERYQSLQYNGLFEDRHRSPVFFQYP